MKEILTEVYATTKKISGIDPSKPGNMRQILVNDAAFGAYVSGLAESIESKKDRAAFVQLAENTRVNLLENSMFQINPYETLTLPILRVFYPKLVAKEAVTVSPMDKPEVVKAFITATFEDHAGSAIGPAPVTATDVSRGPTLGIPVVTTVTLADIATAAPAGYDLFADVTGVTDSTEAHFERDFLIVSTTATTPADVTVANVQPDVEGNFSFSVTNATAADDVISGKIDYLTGELFVSSTSGETASVQIKGTISLEENAVNPRVKLNVDKVRLYAKDRQISANWTINMEQDMRALFDVSMQSEIVNILGQQIALDIDKEIIDSLIAANGLNAASHTRTFDRTPDVAYTWGKKYWHENIIPELNALSAQVYTDTNMDQANTILANPLDVSILEDLQTFNYTGTSSTDGDVGYRSATVAGGKWRVLTSAVVPQGTMLTVYKPAEELKSVYLYCPYVPAVLHPYPLGNTPSLTILSRYATALVRGNGIAQLTITES